MAKTCGNCVYAKICKKAVGSWFSPKNIAYCEAYKDSTNYVEVVHGRWESYGAWGNPYALCSNCGCGLDKNDALNFSYCPYCGAKMDGGKYGGK